MSRKPPNDIELHSEVSIIFKSHRLGLMAGEEKHIKATQSMPRHVYRMEDCGNAFFNELVDLCAKHGAKFTSPTPVKKMGVNQIELEEKVLKVSE